MISRNWQKINNIRTQLCDILPAKMGKDCEPRQKQCFTTTFTRIKHRNINHFNQLKAHCSDHNELFNDNNKWIQNISQVDILQEIADFRLPCCKFLVTYITKYFGGILISQC